MREFQFLFLSVTIKHDRTPAKAAIVRNIIIGTGGTTSAINGANIVANLAPMLHTPKAVPENITGKIVEFAK